MMGKQSSIAKRLVEMSPLGGKHKRTKFQEVPMQTEFLVQAVVTPAIVIQTLQTNSSQRELAAHELSSGSIKPIKTALN